MSESPTGFKTAGVRFTIPDNKDWQTARFRLETPNSSTTGLQFFPRIRRQPPLPENRGSAEDEGGGKSQRGPVGNLPVCSHWRPVTSLPGRNECLSLRQLIKSSDGNCLPCGGKDGAEAIE